ncbi:chorismate mutase [candidate division KSB1 bacterium]|nr:MAG: chorismate mutase [candidate division KSB1 bacterium]
MDKQLKKIREEIDKIDSKIKDLLIKRLEMAERIGVIKKTENLPLIDEGREEEIILRVSDKTGKFQKNMEMIYKKIIEETTLLQREIINDR